MALLHIQVTGKKYKLTFEKWFVLLQILSKGRGDSSDVCPLSSTLSQVPLFHLKVLLVLEDIPP